MKHRGFKMSKALMFILALCIVLPGAALAVTLPETGQNDCYGYSASGDTWAPISCTGTGEDGEKLAGAAWPSPRFVDNGDGTITDTAVGPSSTEYLQWMKNANCLKTYYPSLDTFTGTMPDTAGDGGVNWDTALNFVNGINSGTYPNCSFGKTGWRLPNRNEIASLINFDDYDTVGQYGGLKLYLEAAGFTNIRYDAPQGWAPYWSSTTRTSPTSTKTDAYLGDLGEGLIWWQGKNTAAAVPLGSPTYWSAVLPVRSVTRCVATGPDTDCNGIDEDCDGTPDDGYVSASCDGADADLCAEGTTSCTAGVESCSDNTGDNSELCNGFDDDCNPATADGSGDPGVGVACDGPDSDLCTDDTTSCVSGAIVCSTGTDTIEICGNSIDDDCDGLTDEGCGPSCTDNDGDTYAIEGGACGLVDCNDTDININPGAADTDCDGVDENCSGAADEGYVSVACDGADSDLCTDDTTSCVSGAVVCSVGADNAEVNNNGLDDDCNPATPTASVSGSGYNMPTPLFRASLNVGATVKYYNTRNRLNLSSASFAVSASGGTGTVTGTATVNGVAGCTFTVTVSDGSPDAFGIAVAPGGACTTAYTTGGLSNVVGGSGFVVVGQ